MRCRPIPRDIHAKAGTRKSRGLLGIEPSQSHFLFSGNDLDAKLDVLIEDWERRFQSSP